VLNFLEKNKKITVYFPLVFYWILLIIATSLPSKDIPNLKISDKIEHLLAYLVLGFLFNLAVIFQNKFKLLKKYSFLSTVVFLSIYAIIDELHQIFIPGRVCSFLDWGADTIGILLGVLVTYIFIKIITKTN